MNDASEAKSEARSDRPPSPAALPFLFSGIEVLDAAKHGGLKLNRVSGFRFAAEINSVPLCLDEILIAADHYPIVFSLSGQMPLAVLGCRDRENLFVDAAGRWLPGAYIPAYLRAWPFIAAAPGEDSDNVVIAIEPHSPHLQATDGLPLFDDGKPSRVLHEAVALTSFYRANAQATQRFVSALAEAEVLHESRATLRFRGGETMQLSGFQALEPKAFDRLPDPFLLQWRKENWLVPIYAALRSAARWSRLAELADARRGITNELLVANLHPGA